MAARRKPYVLRWRNSYCERMPNWAIGVTQFRPRVLLGATFIDKNSRGGYTWALITDPGGNVVGDLNVGGTSGRWAIFHAMEDRMATTATKGRIGRMVRFLSIGGLRFPIQISRPGSKHCAKRRTECPQTTLSKYTPIMRKYICISAIGPLWAKAEKGEPIASGDVVVYGWYGHV